MKDVCVEGCAVYRDCSWLELKPWYRLENYSRFPIDECDEMSKEEKYRSVVVYLTAVIDHLTGAENEREDLYNPRGGIIFEALKEQSLSTSSERENTIYPNRTQREDSGE